MRIHFIAIGGAAMHNLALALHDMGHEVSGSDDLILEPSRGRLEAAGLLPPAEGWHTDRITDALDVVILGMHARPDNPELAAAQAIRCAVQSYPEFLFHASSGKRRVVIGGSHGKTTITSMLLHVLQNEGISTDFMVGAQLEGFDRMVHLSDDRPWAVFEGDEYLSSPIDRRPKFHWYRPHIALLTGIAWDHINVFPTAECYAEQFGIFIDTLEPGATLIYCTNDEALTECVEGHARTDLELVRYETPAWNGAGDSAVLHFEDGADVRTSLVGSHNFQNLAGARELARAMGVLPLDFDRAIANFKGASRRLEILHTTSDFVVYRDFAHAPSKLRATQAGVVDSFPHRSVTAVFELHTFSSLNRDFLPEYAGSMDRAQHAVVYYDPEVLAHKKMPDLHPDFVKSCFRRDDLEVITNRDELERRLSEIPAHGQAVLLMSSGWFSGAKTPWEE